MTRPACLLFPEMEQKEGKTSEDGTTVSPTPGAPGGDTSAREEAKGTTSTVTEGPPDGAGKQEKASAEGGASAEFQGEANGLDEVKVESKVEVELPKEDGGKEETKEAPQEVTGGKEETNSEPQEAEGKEGTGLATEKQKAEENAAQPGSREKADVEDQAKAEPKRGAAEQEAGAGSKEADGGQEAMTASPEESAKTEEPKAEAPAKASAPEAMSSDSEKKAALEDEAQAEPQERAPREEVVSEAEERREEAPAPREARPLCFISWGKSSLPPLDIKNLGWGLAEPGARLPCRSFRSPHKALGSACVTMSSPRSCRFQESGGPHEEQDRGAEKESEEGAGVCPSSPEEWPESPTEEGPGLSPGE